MHKVMLVDDDYPVLEYLSQAIPWSELGFEILGCYENGQAAYEDARLAMPDLLLTDIGMPLMNGLDLIKALKDHKPDLRAIIISCHDEFRFAQQAIKLNVHDYILKEALRPQPIIELLSSLKEDLNHLQQMKEQTIQSRKLLKSKLIPAMIDNPSWNPDTWVVQAKEHGLDLAQFTYLPIVGAIDHYQDAKRKHLTNELLHHAVDSILESIVKEEKNIHYFGYSPREIFLFYPFERTISKNAYDEMKGFLKKLNRRLQQDLGMGMTFVTGEALNQPKSIKTQLIRLLEIHENRFYIPEGSILPFSPFAFTDQDIFFHYSQAVQEFQDLIMQERSEAIKNALSHWIDKIRQENYRPKLVKEWALKILLDLKLKFKSLQNFQTTFSVEALDQRMYNVETIFQLKDIMESCLQEMILLVQSIHQQPKRNEILKAQHYISMNLNKKISLAEVADYLHLNASYFSRLFKKETNENFIECVNRLKVNKAKELLDQSCKTVEEVAELLGFENKSYFIKTFKNATGLSPTEYRLKGWEEHKADLKDVVK